MKSQVSGCFNITFICTKQDAKAAARTITDDLLLQGHWGERESGGPSA